MKLELVYVVYGFVFGCRLVEVTYFAMKIPLGHVMAFIIRIA